MPRCLVPVLVALLGAALVAGCGGGSEDQPIRYPHIEEPAPTPVHLPDWIPKPYVGRVEYRPALRDRCNILYGDQEITEAPPGGCRTALEVVAEFDERFGDSAICDQDACPPRTHVVRGWRCRLTSFFDDVYTITCRRQGHVISFGAGG
jgi:hypothetical protein